MIIKYIIFYLVLHKLHMCKCAWARTDWEDIATEERRNDKERPKVTEAVQTEGCLLEKRWTDEPLGYFYQLTERTVQDTLINEHTIMWFTDYCIVLARWATVIHSETNEKNKPSGPQWEHSFRMRRDEVRDVERTGTGSNITWHHHSRETRHDSEHQICPNASRYINTHS